MEFVSGDCHYADSPRSQSSLQMRKGPVVSSEKATSDANVMFTEEASIDKHVSQMVP